jgi:hypothetical protein
VTFDVIQAQKPAKGEVKENVPSSSAKKEESATETKKKSSKKPDKDDDESLPTGKKEEVESEETLSITISSDSDDSDAEATSSSTIDSPETLSTATEGQDRVKKKLSWIQKKKKGLASRAAGSSVGGALFQKYVDKDTQMLIASLCEIIRQEKGSKEAKKTKEEILKVAVKILLLYHEKKLTDESFGTLLFSFRRICSSVRNAYHAKSLNAAVGGRIHGVALQFFANLQTSLEGLVSPNTIQRIHTLIDLVFDPELLVAATKYDKEFQQIAMVLALYLESSK